MNPYADYRMAVERQRELELRATRGAATELRLVARLAALATRLRRTR